MMKNKLFVGSLPWSTTNTQVQNLFTEAGRVVSAEVITDRATGRSKGFAFVVMGTDEEAQKAIELFDGREIEGRSIVVNVARPKEDRPTRYPHNGQNRPGYRSPDTSHEHSDAH